MFQRLSFLAKLKSAALGLSKSVCLRFIVTLARISLTNAQQLSGFTLKKNLSRGNFSMRFIPASCEPGFTESCVFHLPDNENVIQTL